MYLNFMFLDQFLFELLCKIHTETRKHSEAHTDEYSILFCVLQKRNYKETNCMTLTVLILFLSRSRLSLIDFRKG